MNPPQLEILQQLHALLAYHESSGLHAYPRSEEVAAFLRSRPSSELREGKAAQNNQLKPPTLEQEAKPCSPPERISEIAEEVASCRSCDLAAKRIVPVAGRGGGQNSLFIVGGWLIAGDENMNRCTFGREEDLMLDRMLQAIHLSAGQVFVSNIIKCGIDQRVQPKAENIDACLSYLERQIAATAPKIICTMGIAATRTLLQIRQPLSRLRGRFYTFSLGESLKIPLIPTYHPTFLLKNPEMKKATWEDLQLIERRLGA